MYFTKYNIFLRFCSYRLCLSLAKEKYICHIISWITYIWMLQIFEFHTKRMEEKFKKKRIEQSLIILNEKYTYIKSYICMYIQITSIFSFFNRTYIMNQIYNFRFNCIFRYNKIKFENLTWVVIDRFLTVLRFYFSIYIHIYFFLQIRW